MTSSEMNLKKKNLQQTLHQNLAWLCLQLFCSFWGLAGDSCGGSCVHPSACPFFWLTFHSEASLIFSSFFCSLVQRKQLCCCLSQTEISFLRQVEGVCFVLGAHLGQRVNYKSNLFPPKNIFVNFLLRGFSFEVTQLIDWTWRHPHNASKDKVILMSAALGKVKLVDIGNPN